ncbi:MAG: biopolymer transporter ExbD [Pseudomonadota bacterium]
MQFTTRRGRRKEVEISLTPLIDLFLNILTFFLLTTTFASDSIFFVDLPEAKPGISAGERRMISITVDERGQVLFDRKLVSLQDLKTDLNSIPAEKRAAMPVVLRADRNARHGAVVSVIDVVRGLGLTNIGIVTQAQRAP